MIPEVPGGHCCDNRLAAVIGPVQDSVPVQLPHRRRVRILAPEVGQHIVQRDLLLGIVLIDTDRFVH